MYKTSQLRGFFFTTSLNYAFYNYASNTIVWKAKLEIYGQITINTSIKNIS